MPGLGLEDAQHKILHAIELQQDQPSAMAQTRESGGAGAAQRGQIDGQCTRTLEDGASRRHVRMRDRQQTSSAALRALHVIASST
jgi:hypothetical protein